MKRRSLLLGSVFALLLCVTAPAAMADDFCVGVSLPRCPTSMYDLNTTDLTSAINAANGQPGADTVVIAPHTFNLASTLQLLPTDDTEILGSGVGQTVFAGAQLSAPLVEVFAPSGGATVKGFSIEVNGETSDGTGLKVLEATISDFAIHKTDTDNATEFTALELGDTATARDGSIEIDSPAGIGIKAQQGSMTASGITVHSSGFGNSIGLDAIASAVGVHADFDHVRVSNFLYGANVQNRTLNLSDSVIDMGTGGGRYGIYSYASGGAFVNVNIDRVTIAGNYSGNIVGQTGVEVGASSSSEYFHADVNDLVVYDPGPLNATFSCDGGSGAHGVTSVFFGEIAMNVAPHINSECATDPDPVDFINLTAHSPQFRDFAGGDYRLTHSSPLIDQGLTGPFADDATDLAGGKRMVDGNGNGGTEVDLGAFEYQRSAPVISVTGAPATASPGQNVDFSVTGSDPEDEGFSYAWSFDDGASAGNVTSIAHAFTSPGVHVATVTATDVAGAASVATAKVTVQAPVIPDPAATAKLAAKPKQPFKSGTSGFAIAKKGQPSFSVTFTHAAKAKFTLQSVGKKKKLKAIKGSQTLSVKDGTIKFFFGGRKLAPGKYRVTITPLSASGKPGAPVTVDIGVK